MRQQFALRDHPGEWLPTATADNLPDGRIKWTVVETIGGTRGATAMVDGKPVAVIRRLTFDRGWMATMSGYQWQPTPGAIVSKMTPAARFKTLQAAQKNIEAAWSRRPGESQ